MLHYSCSDIFIAELNHDCSKAVIGAVSCNFPDSFHYITIDIYTRCIDLVQGIPDTV